MRHRPRRVIPGIKRLRVPHTCLIPLAGPRTNRRADDNGVLGAASSLACEQLIDRSILATDRIRTGVTTAAGKRARPQPKRLRLRRRSTWSKPTAPAKPRSTRWPGSTVSFQRAVRRRHGTLWVGQVDPHALHGGTRRADVGPLPIVGDQDIAQLDDAGLTELRRDHIGFIFQSFNLVPTLTAPENIVLPADLAGTKVDNGLVRLPGRSAAHRRPPVAPADRDVRGPAAARRLCSGPHRPTGPDLRRRAHRQPRLERLGRDARLPAAIGDRDRASRSSWSPTIRTVPPTPTGWCSSLTGRWSAISPPRRPTRCSSG